MSKIFVRQRRQVGQGAGKPRFAIVAVEGLDLKVYQTHIRRMELEKLAESTGAEIVYLPRGETEEQGEAGTGGGRQHRRKQRGERQE